MHCTWCFGRFREGGSILDKVTSVGASFVLVLLPMICSNENGAHHSNIPSVSVVAPQSILYRYVCNQLRDTALGWSSVFHSTKEAGIFIAACVMSGYMSCCRWALYAHSFYLSRRGDILDYYPQWQVFNWLTHTVLDGRISTGLGRCG